MTIIAFIGIILLIGIVKKNAIMMIDFALAARARGARHARGDHAKPACCASVRFMMTTMAAMFGALPLAFGSRRGGRSCAIRLGITIVGGLHRQPGVDAIYDAGDFSAARQVLASGAGTVVAPNIITGRAKAWPAHERAHRGGVRAASRCCFPVATRSGRIT